MASGRTIDEQKSDLESRPIQHSEVVARTPFAQAAQEAQAVEDAYYDGADDGDDDDED